MTLWYREASRDSAEAIDKPALLVDQIKDLNKMIKRDPGNEVRRAVVSLACSVGADVEVGWGGVGRRCRYCARTSRTCRAGWSGLTRWRTRRER
jgi:hypothetical protein